MEKVWDIFEAEDGESQAHATNNFNFIPENDDQKLQNSEEEDELDEMT